MAKAGKRRGKAKPKIIANMGLFWHRDKVLWRGNISIGPKCLEGVRASAKTAGVVNFWKQVGIYALYDADYHLIYVGQVGLGDKKSCIGCRLNQHRKDYLAGRWDMFSWFGFCKVRQNRELGTKFLKAKATWSDVADVLEGVLIEVAEPPQNSQSGRFGPGVHRYLQYPPKQKDLIKQIAKDIERIKKHLKVQKKKKKKKK